MHLHVPALHFARIVDEVATTDDLATALTDLAHDLGFAHFALSHHGDLALDRCSAIRLHNYPSRWADYYDGEALGRTDPVHRASQVTAIGFRWDAIPAMIALTASDRAMLARGRREGIGHGFTVPAHVPGEACGSCTFANPHGRWIEDAALPAAQLAGSFAFEAARRLWTDRGRQPPTAPRLTDRQRDCLELAARGKGDWEIGRILGISEETATCHIRQACERYGVNKRTSLVVRALFDGTLTFTEIFRR